ncbi:hypothetical protein PHYBLDRAFT_142158 [Phycomyces blakesleeanus NRRL 1555(-)]|uniref:Uncharacterized protein n=1 Tax=Phycomyces blakesleeanus (strain ATCC 8743b / DSM 1359 / FGSC 10004 / NBRC 33097 / NRRL 1555) TaxID=763407 RepID=A0A162UNQ0_PHYB8|nr:hypothetical protein PHYBLDRAFT_142158 [Phycomyces blakesleeanus NRRL 1555(-)]OAD76643.1 hypothetical protein PHYBLDRAFT_142158 [Phycomyces blakesleeanus NRRL 1555(-)]|eukprot:XP_018294683.1 hypothetical protein PHYBLDRAFT_142158 [Phycomyces blakesleeanus NRRL 1555(-)]
MRDAHFGVKVILMVCSGCWNIRDSSSLAFESLETGKEEEEEEAECRLRENLRDRIV